MKKKSKSFEAVLHAVPFFTSFPNSRKIVDESDWINFHQGKGKFMQLNFQ